MGVVERRRGGEETEEEEEDEEEEDDVEAVDNSCATLEGRSRERVTGF